MQFFDKQILIPITTQNLAGEDMSFSDLYENLVEHRRENLFAVEPKHANWVEVIKVANKLLIEHTKDLSVLEFLMEAAIKQGGFGGLAEGLEMCSQFLAEYWPICYPNSEDLEDRDIIRTNCLFKFDKFCELAVTRTPIIKKFGYWDYQQATNKYFIPETASEDETQRIKAEAVNAKTIDSLTWSETINQTPAEHLRSLYDLVEKCLIFKTQIEEQLDRHLTTDGFRFLILGDLLENIRTLIQEHLPLNTPQMDLTAVQPGDEPAEISNQITEKINQGDHRGFRLPDPKTVHFDFSNIDSRDKAFLLVDQIANFFESTEPLSPVGPLLRNAIRIGKMDLAEWIKESIEDESTRSTLLKFYFPHRFGT